MVLEVFGGLEMGNGVIQWDQWEVALGGCDGDEVVEQALLFSALLQGRALWNWK